MNRRGGAGSDALHLAGLLQAAGWAVLGAVRLLGAPAHASAAPLTVRTQSGWVRGTLDRGALAFEGIPYAAPPLGALRWAAPQPPPSWRGVRPARRFAPDCMQRPTPGDMAPLRTRPSENCLYVNVWRPMHATRKPLPVMVWIYGGWFVDGGSSPAIYDGASFARHGVVLVSFNYRLGNFGFFAFPALVHHGLPAGDFGFMDQIAALRWVQRNIAAFGGDPRNVTLFGESAGGASVNALLITPQARGLFQKAIIESGGGAGWLGPDRALRGGAHSAQAIGVRLARQLGITGQGMRALAALRSVPAAAILDGVNMATRAQVTGYVGGPVVDDSLYFGPPVRAYAQGMGARVPVMIGSNSADLGSVPGHSLGALFAEFGAHAAEARAAFDPQGRASLQQVRAEIGGALWMIQPARAIARILSARGQPVYAYRYAYIATAMRQKAWGAGHATEIPFVFNTVRARYGAQTSPADEAMARVMQRYWIAFARTGRADPPGEPAWPRYRARSARLMLFTEHGPRVGADPDRRRLALTLRAGLQHPGGADQGARAAPAGNPDAPERSNTLRRW